jgi:hypothetical protein
MFLTALTTTHACILKDLATLRKIFSSSSPLRLHIQFKLLNGHGKDGARCVSFSSSFD